MSGMKRAEPIRIIYIAGSGRSGSTLVDVLLGQCSSTFSAGELSSIAKVGIVEENCSCGSKVADCSTWQEVMSTWALSRKIDISRYQELRRRFEFNQSCLTTLANVIWRSAEFDAYCYATQCLFVAIQDVTGKPVIIDSSKFALRILILRQFSDLTVIHICRNFTGVMNSLNRPVLRNGDSRVGSASRSRRPVKALVSWLANNFLVEMLTVGVRRYRVHYRRLVNEPNRELGRLGDEFLRVDDEPIVAAHMLAGNRMRFGGKIEIDSESGFLYKNLTKTQLRFGAFVDSVFWFWSRA